MDLSVIIPAYNEEKRISSTLEAVYAYLQAQSLAWEIIIVLDGVKDDTAGVITRFQEGMTAAHKPQLRVINRTENRGKGYTVREGMIEAGGAIRLFTDADNSTDISHFDLMRPLFDAGHDVVICSRDSKDVDGAKQAVPQSFFKRLLGNLGNLFIQIVAVPGIWDTQCGFKAFTAESATAIFPHTTIDRWAFDIEALALARRFDYNIGIVPAHWIDAEGTHVKTSDYIDTIWQTVKIRNRVAKIEIERGDGEI